MAIFWFLTKFAPSGFDSYARSASGCLRNYASTSSWRSDATNRHSGARGCSSRRRSFEEHLRRCVVVPERTAIVERLPTGGIVAEVGTLHGEFAREILRLTQPRELHLIDHEIHPDVHQLANDPAFRDRLHMHHWDSVAALESFPDRYLGLDLHRRAARLRRRQARIQSARRKVRRDGFLVFNDYTIWSYVEMEPYGVVAAVDERCIEDGWEIVMLALPSHMYCDVAVQKIR